MLNAPLPKHLKEWAGRISLRPRAEKIEVDAVRTPAQVVQHGRCNVRHFCTFPLRRIPRVRNGFSYLRRWEMRFLKRRRLCWRGFLVNPFGTGTAEHLVYAHPTKAIEIPIVAGQGRHLWCSSPAEPDRSLCPATKTNTQ